MGPIALLVLSFLIGLLWQIAPGKTISEMLSLTRAEGLVAGPAEPAVRSHGSPIPAAQCASCHPQHYDEWSRSFHARSLTSDDFVRTFAQYLDSVGKQARDDPQSSMACLSCHAPLLKHAAPDVVRRVTDIVLAKETKKLDGFEVGCAACHVPANRVFSGPIEKPQENPFHLSKFSTSYRESSFCADCHAWTSSTVPCSDVYSEWKKSRAAKQGTTCQSCHMAERSGTAASGGPQRKIHSHVFPGARSAVMLKQAVNLRLKAGFRKDRLEVTATVRNLAPHRVPDG
jgi:mono/diheme cytochrome c family protein